jgi:hypothetical protein
MPLAFAGPLGQTGGVDDEKPSSDEKALPPRVDRVVDQDIGILTPEQIQDKIREKAFELYQQRVATGGNPDEKADWYAAEREILERYRSPLTDLGAPVWGESPRRGRNGPDR